MKKVVSVLLFVVAIVMIGSGVYIMNSSKYLFSTALDGIFNYLTDGYTEMSERIKNSDNVKKYKVSTDTVLSDSSNELVSLQGDMYLNAFDKKMYINLNSKLKEEDFVSLEGLVDSEKFYVKIKEVMKNFYYTDLTSQSSGIVDFSKVENIDSSQLLKLEDKEINLLVKYLKKSILKDLKDSDFKKSSEILKIEGKSYKTNKISLGLSEQEMVSILKNFLTEINKDNNAIKILQKVNKDITKEMIKEIIDSFNNQNLPAQDEISISFYVENFVNIRRIELEEVNSEVDGMANSNVLLRIDLLERDSFIISLIQGEKEQLRIKSEKVNQTQSKITLEINDYVINGTYTSTDKSTELNMTYLAEGKEVATLSMKTTELTKNKEYKIDFTVKVPDMEMDFVSKNTILLNEDVPDIDISDAKDMEEMSEEEQEKLATFIQEKMDKLGLNTTEDNDI